MKIFKKKVTVYVDPKNGNDDGRGSKNFPYRTLNRACAVIESKLNRSSEETAYRVVLLNGRHLVREPIVMCGDHVKALDYSLTFSAEGDATVTSAVEIPVNSFKKIEDRPYYAYTLPKDETVPLFRDFFCDGKFVTLATSGDERVMHFSIPNDKDRRDPQNEIPKLYISPDAVAGIPADHPMPLELWIKVEWQLFAVRVLKIDHADTKTTENGETHIAVHIEPEDWKSFVPGFYATLRNRFYWGKNHLSYLTSENQFFFDKGTRTIYFYPASGVDMATAVCSYPVTENLFMFKNMRNVEFNGITFTGTTSNYISENGYIAGQGGRIKKNKIGFLTHAAIQAHNTYGLSVYNCRFYSIGGDGINTTGCTESATIEHCSFENISMSAIRIGSCMGRWNTFTNINTNIRIVNNYIKHPGVFYKSNVGIVVGPVRNLKICKNTLVNTPYSAVSVGWSWSKAEWEKGTNVNIQNAEIAYNRVVNFMWAMKDGGALYVLGGNCGFDEHEPFNSIHDNYCVGGPTTGQGNAAIGKRGHYTVLYHDGSSSNWHTYSNVVQPHPNNNSGADHIALQSVGTQQVYNITVNDNYLLYMNDPERLFGKNLTTKQKEKDLYLKVKNNKIGLTLDTLDKKARAIIDNAGADGHEKGEVRPETIPVL